MNEFVFLSWRLGNTWNLKSKFNFQVFLSRQDRKTNSFVHFLGEVTARQFCFEIYWPLAFAVQTETFLSSQHSQKKCKRKMIDFFLSMSFFNQDGFFPIFKRAISMVNGQQRPFSVLMVSLKNWGKLREKEMYYAYLLTYLYSKCILHTIG